MGRFLLVFRLVWSDVRRHPGQAAMLLLSLAVATGMLALGASLGGATETLYRRRENKRALQARAGLPQRDDVPLVAMVTRLDRQKGLDITGHVLHLLLNGHAGEVQCVVLGAGAASYEPRLPQNSKDSGMTRQDSCSAGTSSVCFAVTFSGYKRFLATARNDNKVRDLSSRTLRLSAQDKLRERSFTN